MSLDLVAVDSWAAIVQELRALPAGGAVTITRGQLPHPSNAGARPSTGLPLGQWSDWRWRLAGGGSLHVREYPNRYDAHIDQVDPGDDLVGHLALDAPGAAVVAASLAGALLGRAAGGDRGAGWGALLGGVAGLATVQHVKRRRRLARPR